MIDISIEEKSALINQIGAIREKVLDLAVYENDDVYWLTPTSVKDSNQSAHHFSIDIFNGNCGIAIFFMALFQYGKNPADIDVAKKILNKVLQSDEVKSPRFFGFYTGLSGVVYSLVKMYEITDEKKYLETARKLVLENANRLITGMTKADFLSGYCGNLFVITALYHHSQENVILNLIKKILDRVIDELRISKKGIKWDYTKAKSAYDSMTGFSHGASGIAYALMQVGNYFKNDGLVYLAEQALAYEMQYFNLASENWLDLRMGSHRLSHDKAHQWDLAVFIPTMREVNSWAHGAAGIGIARLFAYEVTRNNQYLMQCQIAAKRCIYDIQQNTRTDFTLCSGYSGMIPFLSAFINVKTKPRKIDELLSIPKKAKFLFENFQSYNTYIKTNNTDAGLLSGISGIGYMLLHLLNTKMNSICGPSLPLAKHGNARHILPGKDDLIKKIFNRYYPKSISLIKEVSGDFLQSVKAESIPEFEDEIRRIIKKIPEKEATVIKEVFYYEYRRTQCWKLHKGYLCYAVKNDFLTQKNKKVLLAGSEAILKSSFTLSEHVTFYPLKKILKTVLGINPLLEAVLFVSNESGLNEIFIGRISSLIVQHLQYKSRSGQEIVDFVSVHFQKTENESSKLLLHKHITEQMLNMLKTCIIGQSL